PTELRAQVLERLPLVLFGEPRVDARDVAVLVPEYLADDLERHPGLSHERARGASEVVERDVLEAGGLPGVLPLVPEVPSVRPLRAAGEDVRVALLAG